MSSKLVVPADIFNLFEIEKSSKLQKNLSRDSSPPENSVKSEQNKNKTNEKREEPTANENTDKHSLEYPNNKFTKTNTNHKLLGLKPEKSDILDKMESDDMNCSNNDNKLKENELNESQMNGEPPTTAIGTSPSMSGQVEISSLQTVDAEGSAHSQPVNNLHKSPIFLIKNGNGKAVPLVFKNSILFKNSEIVEQKVFGNNNRTFITLPNKLIANGNVLTSPNSQKLEISTPILIISPNSKPNEQSPQICGKSSERTKEKVEKSTEISTKISTEKSTKISTEKPENELNTTKSGIVSTKLVLNRKLVTVSTSSTSTVSTTTSNSDLVSTFQEFVINTSSGKQVIIPNKLKPQPLRKLAPKVDILEKNVEEAPKSSTENVSQLEPIKNNLLNTKNIIINNQLVPVNFNTKFTVESGSNTPVTVVDTNEPVLNIITTKKVETKKKRKVDKTKKIVDKQNSKNIAKQPEERLFQLKVEKEKSARLIFRDGKNENINKKCGNVKNDVALLSGCEQLPMCVENWTQTDVKRQDAACQTDVYVCPPTPGPIFEPVEEECPNIPELIEYLLFNPKYNTGMDETTKTDIINNSLKFKPPEMAPIPIPTAAAQPALTLKQRLFFDLRDCVSFDFLGNMPIHNAVLDNNVNDLKRQVYALRLRRFSVDVENNFNQTALQLAVINNKSRDIIATLLLNGANVCPGDNLGNTLLHLAVLNTSHDILELILGYLNKDTQYINIKNDEGLTPLMIASIECKHESVGVLLKFGADPNLRDDKSGRTALFHAVELNNVPVVNLLLHNKADPKVRNFFGLTAIDAVKDLNAPFATLIERQATRPNTFAEAGGSPKRRTNKRRPATAERATKMTVVSKKLKVDLGKLEKQATGSQIKMNSPKRKK